MSDRIKKLFEGTENIPLVDEGESVPNRTNYPRFQEIIKRLKPAAYYNATDAVDLDAKVNKDLNYTPDDLDAVKALIPDKEIRMQNRAAANLEKLLENPEENDPTKKLRFDRKEALGSELTKRMLLDQYPTEYQNMKRFGHEGSNWIDRNEEKEVVEYLKNIAKDLGRDNVDNVDSIRIKNDLGRYGGYYRQNNKTGENQMELLKRSKPEELVDTYLHEQLHQDNFKTKNYAAFSGDQNIEKDPFRDSQYSLNNNHLTASTPLTNREYEEKYGREHTNHLSDSYQLFEELIKKLNKKD